MGSSDIRSLEDAVVQLSELAAETAPGRFDADISVLGFLAGRVGEERGREGEALAVREFCLQFRKTADRVTNAALKSTAALDDIDWKARVEGRVG